MGVTRTWGDSFPRSIRQTRTYAPWAPLPFTALNCSTLLLLWGLNPNSYWKAWLTDAYSWNPALWLSQRMLGFSRSAQWGTRVGAGAGALRPHPTPQRPAGPAPGRRLPAARRSTLGKLCFPPRATPVCHFKSYHCDTRQTYWYNRAETIFCTGWLVYSEVGGIAKHREELSSL